MAKLTREMIIEAMETGEEKPGRNSIGYCIPVLHPGDEMFDPATEGKPRPKVYRNSTTSDMAFRLAWGMGWWVGPTSAGEIHHDDAPTICSHGIGKHNPPTPEDVKAERAAKEAAARKAADRQQAAEDWAHKRVEEMFNSGLGLSREDLLARYRAVWNGLAEQWKNDNPARES